MSSSSATGKVGARRRRASVEDGVYIPRARHGTRRKLEIQSAILVQCHMWGRLGSGVEEDRLPFGECSTETGVYRPRRMT